MVELNQHPYAERFEVKSMVPVVGVSVSRSQANGSHTEEDTEEMRGTPCWEAVRALMWASSMTRPDVDVAILTVATLCDNLGRAHTKVVRRVLQYLLQKQDPGSKWGEVHVGGLGTSAYVDADHAT